VKKIDLPNFEKLLIELAECYDRKPPTAAAIGHWFDALLAFSWSQVERELRHWLTTKNKFPTIAEIFLSMNEKNIDEREAKWAAEKKQALTETTTFGKSPEGTKFFAQIKKTLSSVQPDSNTWAYRILDRHADGHDVSYIALKSACEALRIDPRAVTRSKKQLEAA
jgi:hypothetical protein